MDDQALLRSVLFADVSGSVRLHEKLGGAEAQRAVDRCVKRVSRSVDAYGGKIIKTVGNELMIIFDRVESALHAAVDMQQRVTDLPAVSGIRLSIRVGFAHGLVSENGDSAVGEAVDVAAHLAGLAKPGQILTDLQSYTSLPPELQASLHELASAPAKGNSPGMRIFEAVGAADKSESVEGVVAGQSARLLLRYDGEVIVVDALRPIIVIGRDAESGLVIKGRRASRSHATIERKGNKFVLLDQSTNGTYLTLGGAREVLLRGEARVIHGKGVICIAAPAAGEDVDRVEFEEL